MIRAAVLKNGLLFDVKKYEYKDDFVPADIKNPMEVHTTQEMIECMKNDPKIKLEARIIGVSKGQKAIVKMNREAFLQSVKQRDSKKMREAIDSFAWDDGQTTSGLVGHDFTPLLGGPFNKQLYY